MATVLKGAAILATLILAGLGIAFVTGLLPREALLQQSLLVLAVVAILAVVGLVLNLLLKRPDAR
ncbi:MAG TPA: hypothetical protein VGE51_05950 [Fontimonas sp.]